MAARTDTEFNFNRAEVAVNPQADSIKLRSREPYAKPTGLSILRRERRSKIFGRVDVDEKTFGVGHRRSRDFHVAFQQDASCEAAPPKIEDLIALSI